MEENITCPKCKSEMEKGILGDAAGDVGERTETPQWGTGMHWILASLKNPRDVVTYRCTSCGYLESYAK